MKRRQLLKNMAVGAAGVGLGFRMPLVHAMDYTGKLFVFVQAQGGWDPTSFCDPKTNTNGEPIINNWATSSGIQQAGNIPYAPFANNQSFLEKYFARMLVINGVDAQTNSHTVGVLHNWSGRNSEGFPTMTALLAANYAPDVAMPYLTFGGFSTTAGVVRFTRLDNPSLVQNIAAPAVTAWDAQQEYVPAASWALLESHRAARVDALNAGAGILPRAARNRDYFRSAIASTDGLQAFADIIPPADQLQQPEQLAGDGGRSTLKQQAQLALLAFKSGVAVSADLFLGGFDTHQGHDADHGVRLANLTDSVDYLWDYAETLELADRLVVVMGSDFGRTNRYNDDGGKDHWPIGSFVVMEKNQSWTNRVAGETSAIHETYAIDPVTLARDDTNGTIIYPKHVHKALRNYLGIELSQDSQKFPFNNTQEFAFFG